MVNIVVEYNEGDQQLFTHYWCPLLYKYEDQKVQFTFVDKTTRLSKIAPKLSNVKITHKLDSNKTSKTTTVFTKTDLVPTYSAMVVFKQSKKNIINILEGGKIISQPSESLKLIAFEDDIIIYKVEKE